MRLPPVALALLCAIASGCGGDGEEAPAPARSETAPATEPAATERARAPRETDERREPAGEREAEERAGRDTTGPEEPEPAREPGEQDDDGRRRSSRAELRRFLEDAKRTVRRTVRLIGAGDASVCRRYFTQRYAERVSGLRGEAAFDRCERDIARSQGGLRFVAFGPSRIEDTRATVRFNLDVGGRTTAEEWRLVLVDGDWLVDES